MSTPTAMDASETSRVPHYSLEYIEDINQRMRIPDTLRVTDTECASLDPALALPSSHHQHPRPAAFMHVPERITVAGKDGGGGDGQEHPGDYLHVTYPTSTTPAHPNSDGMMMPPPRVLTLLEKPLECLESQTRTAPSPPSPVVRVGEDTAAPSRHGHDGAIKEGQWSSSHGENQSAAGETNVTARSQHGRQVDVVEPGTTPLSPSSSARPPLSCLEDADANLYTLEGLSGYLRLTTARGYQQVLELLERSTQKRQLQQEVLLPDELDASALRQQIEMMNRRLWLLEEESRERARQALVLCTATVSFCLAKALIRLCK